METDPHAKLKRGLVAIAALREILGKYKFSADSEATVQRQVLEILPRWTGVTVIGSEVIVDCGRFDVLVDFEHEHKKTRIALELKVRGTVGAVEEQAQRYARNDGVDAVVVVTTSSKLARELAVDMSSSFVHQTLGGKPFGVIHLRTAL